MSPRDTKKGPPLPKKGRRLARRATLVEEECRNWRKDFLPQDPKKKPTDTKIFKSYAKEVRASLHHEILQNMEEKTRSAIRSYGAIRSSQILDFCLFRCSQKKIPYTNFGDVKMFGGVVKKVKRRTTFKDNCAVWNF